MKSNKIRRVIKLVIISIIALIGLLIIDNKSFAAYYDTIEGLKSDYNNWSQIGRTKNLSYTELKGKSTVWCIQRGQSLSSDPHEYIIDTIVNIGRAYIEDNTIENKFSTAVAYRKNGSGNKISPTSPNSSDTGSDRKDKSERNARLAYVIYSGHMDDYEYIAGNDYKDFGPQVALWAYNDNWRFGNAFYVQANSGSNKNLLKYSDWGYSYTESTIAAMKAGGDITDNGIDDAKEILGDSYIYAKFITNSSHGYNKNGKLSASKSTGTVTENDGKYYAGPFSLNFSYYDKRGYNTDDTTYLKYASKKAIGLLESIKINGKNVDVTYSIGGNKIDIKDMESDKDFYIILNELPSSATITATVKQSEFELISARIWFMKHKEKCKGEYDVGELQHLLITQSTATTVKGDDLTANLEIQLPTDVSLQKYITKVNGNNLTDNETVLINRKNTYSRTDETNAAAKRHPNPRNIATSNYKLSNAVQIEAGDKVTYRIYVYNNSTVTANKVEIIDKLLYYNDTETQYSNYQIVSITRDGGNRNIQNEWTYLRGTTPHQYKYTINNLAGGAETYFDITVKLNTYLHNTVLGNTAYISGTTPNNTTDYRTLDRDYIKMKPYKVSLQKIVDSVNGNTSGITSFDRWSSWESNENKANKNTNTYKKHNNPVTVVNGDYVTYAIKVRNDGETIVKSFKVKDTLPQGLSEYKEGMYETSGTYIARPNNGEITLNVNRQLNPGQEFVLYITAKVSESNMSTRVLQNKAEILNNEITNKNDVVIQDTTPNNNQDADYIQLKDITIAGTVWNDIAFDKTQNNYNGVYDEGQEIKLSEIKVRLFRNNGQGYTLIADTKTDDNGNYKFDASMIYNSIHACEKHIKAPYQCSNEEYMAGEHQANYWKENSYYSYVVQFVYDGITYTSTVLGSLDAENYTINSNASENEYSRKYFNDKFAKINKDSGINYTTKNEDGYIPQSNHIYDENKMAMYSNAYVSIAKLTEEQLQHVNLGLRGRDVFDLELTSDVYSTKVSVNGQDGTYNYNSNKVTVRKSDISVAEDAANIASEIREGSIGEVEQTIRTTDLDINKANETAVEKYTETGLGIEVTYKITVTNASQTDGTATKIVNYYDSRYTCVEAHVGDSVIKAKDLEDGDSGKGFKSKIIPTQGTNLTQSSDPMEIYVVYTLNSPTTTLANLLNGTDRIPTYNMAEIYEYTTKCAEGQTEFTRGLIDKDSAPGSANQEQVRLTSTQNQETATKNGNPTTVGYYFGGNDLSKLKYEDDTYATPTLYFTSSDKGRTLSGVVFRDKTTTDSETRIKTGNGVKDEGEEPVYGATVELVELNDKTISPENIKNSDGAVRYTVNTKEDGSYTFKDFLPGNYVIRYHYGDTTKTVLLNQSEDGSVNKYSFNGEDYQSTNNIGTYGASKLYGYNEKSGKFENTTDWYAYNEKESVSTGTDNTARRKDVSKTVTDYTDEKMTVLNNVRDNKTVTESEVNKLIEDTNMYSTTPNFTLSVEKTETDGENKNATQKTAFAEYEITNMNFGIAEVPVTTIDLQKHVAGFTIKDSAGDNVIASLTKQADGTWKTTGDVLPLENAIYDISIEDEKLQGAKLEVTYDITANIIVEKNFDGKEVTKATINSLVDYIDNDLSYNENLGQNSTFWEVTTYEDTNATFRTSEFTDSNGNKKERKGKLDPDGKVYTQIVKAKEGNPLLGSSGGSVPITLEKTISATDTTIGDIITSNVNTYEYNNNVEITNIKYENTETDATGDNFVFRDRVRTPSRNIILAGLQYDDATSETITIHPPTGDNNNMMYYIIAVISLGVLAIGIVFIKKYAIKKD